jgi:hypothetical protein
MLIPKATKSLENLMIWAALRALGRGVSWKAVKARRLVGAVDDTQLSLENITLSNGAQVLAHLKERESLLVERRTVSHQKASALITLSSTILSGSLALVSVRLMTAVNNNYFQPQRPLLHLNRFQAGLQQAAHIPANDDNRQVNNRLRQLSPQRVGGHFRSFVGRFRPL